MLSGMSTDLLFLNRDTLLQRAFDATVVIRGEVITLTCGDRSLVCGVHALAILEVFATPKTLAEGLEELSSRSRGVLDWVRLSNEVLVLARSGVLLCPDVEAIELLSEEGKFSSLNVHIRMLSDDIRTLAYQHALNATIQPADVVLDIGTGSGILAASAALAGARHVYAVERSSSIAKLAGAFFKANKLDHRITLIEGESSRIELPEKADVLVSEIIGNDPLSEGILATTADARKRLLNPGARLLPQELRLFALPVTAPESFYEQFVCTFGQAAVWAQRYGLDFSIYADECRRRNFTAVINTAYTKEWRRLAQPVPIAQVDFYRDDLRRVAVSREFDVEVSGQLNCVILVFELQLSPEVFLSTHPDQVNATNHWASWAWLSGAPLAVSAGQRLRLEYRFNTESKSSLSMAVIES